VLVLLVFDIESLAFCDRVVNGEVVPDLVPGVIMLLLSFSRDGKETLFGIDDDIILFISLYLLLLGVVYQKVINANDERARGASC